MKGVKEGKGSEGLSVLGFRVPTTCRSKGE